MSGVDKISREELDMILGLAARITKPTQLRWWERHMISAEFRMQLATFALVLDLHKRLLDDGE